MESELLQLIIVFVVGLVSGALIMLLWNKLSSGSASPAGLKQEYQDYQEKVEAHFEETSKKFQDMTEQYQDLYKHLSVGATSLCRSDSVAAGLVDDSQPQLILGNSQNVVESVETVASDKAGSAPEQAEGDSVGSEEIDPSLVKVAAEEQKDAKSNQ
jgi:uncharacterized membrane-anchored protein YhcB (DUF1043 family)